MGWCTDVNTLAAVYRGGRVGDIYLAARVSNYRIIDFHSVFCNQPPSSDTVNFENSKNKTIEKIILLIFVILNKK